MFHLIKQLPNQKSAYFPIFNLLPTFRDCNYSCLPLRALLLQSPFGESPIRWFFFLLLPFYFLLLISCSKSTTDPPPPPPAGPDTTSHNFVWQIDTIGVISSYLLDVAIINENDIWAVGEIYLRDSTGVLDNEPYGAIHWNGSQWTLMKVPYHDFGSTTLHPGPIRTIYAFSASEVYATSSANLLKWNGSSWEEKAFFMTGIPFDGQVRKIWGSTPSNIFCVGNSGAIYHYTGSSWQKIESGTNIDIQDIWGAENPETGELEILAVASNGPLIPQAKQLLKIEGTTAIILPDSGLPYNLNGIWFIPGETYFVTGDGVYYLETPGQAWQADTTHPLLYKDAIRGSGKNDIVIAGSFGLVSHFNGSGWYHYQGKEIPQFYGRYHAVDFRNNFLIAVGSINAVQGIILRGRRN
jgi:hypothetical protein